jgi:hypothetical protein
VRGNASTHDGRRIALVALGGASPHGSKAMDVRGRLRGYARVMFGFASGLLPRTLGSPSTPDASSKTGRSGSSTVNLRFTIASIKEQVP